MIRRSIIPALFLLLGAGRPGAGQRPPTKASIARFERTLDSLRRRAEIPGLSAAIIYKDSVIWSRGFGYADVEGKVAATPHTPYSIASLSKPIASVMLLRLVEQGKLSLDDPVSKYSTDFHSDSVRIRHLLTHTSGGVPGTTYEYNGNLYAELFDPIVKASGRRYREMMSNDILLPLGMLETAPGNDMQPGQPAMQALLGRDNAERYAAVVARIATPYNVDSLGRVVRSAEEDFGLSPANGVVSTVLDLAKFDRAVDRNTLLRDSTRRMMWTPARAPDGTVFPYALGWFTQPYGDEQIVWHNGYLPGRYSALYLKRPAAHLTMILLANSDALSAPFRLALGDVRRSAFACAFMSTVFPVRVRSTPESCSRISAGLLDSWRVAHRLH